MGMAGINNSIHKNLIQKTTVFGIQKKRVISLAWFDEYLVQAIDPILSNINWSCYEITLMVKLLVYHSWLID